MTSSSANQNRRFLATIMKVALEAVALFEDFLPISKWKVWNVMKMNMKLWFCHSNLKITLGKVRNLIGKKCWMWLLCKFCQKKAHIFGFSFSSLFLLQRWRWCLPWEQKIDIFQIEFEVLFNIAASCRKCHTMKNLNFFCQNLFLWQPKFKK